MTTQIHFMITKFIAVLNLKSKKGKVSMKQERGRGGGVDLYREEAFCLWRHYNAFLGLDKQTKILNITQVGILLVLKLK